MKPYTSVHRLVSSNVGPLAILLILTLRGSALYAQAPEPGISLRPSSGPAGTTVAVSGTGFFDSPCGVNLFLDSQRGVLLGSSQTDKGSFDATITIPLATPIGAHTMVAQGLAFEKFCEPSGEEARTIFTVDSPGGSLLLLNRFHFDPVQGEPEIPPDQRTEYAPGHEGFHLVQFVGPTQDAWLRRLQATGVIMVQFQPTHAYIVRMSPEEAAVVATFDFVRAVNVYHAAYRIAPSVLQRFDQVVIENVEVTIYDAQNIAQTIVGITQVGGRLIEQFPTPGNTNFITTLFLVPPQSVIRVAQMNAVLWLNFREPITPDLDEMSSQIQAGNFNPLGTGYLAWLAEKGVSGDGVVLAALDRGYDTGIDATAHPDISGHSVMVSDSVGPPTDQNGHGTHVGGIIAGNANLGTPDANGFFMGLGVAPDATLVVRRRTIDTDAAQTQAAVVNGAIASNHSYQIHASGAGYDGRDRTYDSLVRDADQTTAGLEALVVVFAAGNNAAAGPTAEAKNVIAVAATQNQRDGNGVPGIGNIATIAGFSSRGPAQDARLYPHIAAPGANIISTLFTGAPTSCNSVATGAPGTDPTYSMCSGTSMAAPHVTGSVALIAEWWRTFNAGADPSPAMTKALLINGAVDMGTADIPNNNEGWGRVNLDNVIVPPLPTIYEDQSTLFGGTGAARSFLIAPVDLTQPLKVTLAWSDAPGPGSGGATAAWVNDLDLTVRETSTATTFLGNVFANGFSTSGGAADPRNNVENAFVQAPVGLYEIIVAASNIAGDGVPGNADTTDQDFAFVCFNCSETFPILTIPVETVDLGQACDDDTVSEILYVCNTGTENLEIEDITSSNPRFSVTEPSSRYPVVISSDFCFPFDVLFSPTISGAQSSSLTVFSNDPVNPAVTVEARGEGSASRLVTVIADNGSFGDVCQGAVKDLTLVVSNSGDCNLSIESITSDSTDFQAPSVQGFPLILAPGDSIKLPIRFAPGTTGSKNATITIVSNHPGSPTQVAVSGNVPSGDIRTTGSLEFGDVCRDASRHLSLVISNSGRCDLTVNDITSSSSEFEVAGIDSFPLVIGPGDSIKVPIRFAPTTLGGKSAVLTIVSDDPDSANRQVSLSGNVPAGDIRPTEPTDPVDFGSVCPKDDGIKDVAVCNVGKCNLNVAIASIDCTDFTLVNNPFPAPVSPDFCMDLIVRFTPSSAGPKECTLTVVSDDPDTPVLTVTLRADTPFASIEVPPDLAFLPTVIQSVDVCESFEAFPVSNTGQCDLQITAFSIADNPDEYSIGGLPPFPIILAPGHIVGEGDLDLIFAPHNLARNRLGIVSVTYVYDSTTGETRTVTRNLCGEGVRTGARVLVTAGGVPLPTVKSIKLQRINANRNRSLLDTVDTSLDVPLATVSPGHPCGSFQYHKEYGAIGNPIQLLPGSYQVTVQVRLNGQTLRKTVGFDVGSCDFNPTVTVGF